MGHYHSDITEEFEKARLPISALDLRLKTIAILR